MATGPKQLVVQLARLIILCSSFIISSFTPMTTVTSGSVAGALIRTLFAPAARCFAAPSRLVKNPVDSNTTSILLLA